MSTANRIHRLVLVAGVMWGIVMAVVFYVHYVLDVEEELGYFSSNIKVDSEIRNYFGIYSGDHKIGYKSDVSFPRFKLRTFREDAALKLNLAGLSREVFIQSVASLDTVTFRTKYLEYRIDSGTHVYMFNGTVSNDSLYLSVKNNTISPFRTGVFLVDPNITLPVALPYCLHKSATPSMTIEVFDPVEFKVIVVHAVRIGGEVLKVEGKRMLVTRYNLSYGNRRSSIWLDDMGQVVNSVGFLFFSDVFGSLNIRRSTDKSVFLLPLEVTYGGDLLQKLLIDPGMVIDNPRKVTYLEVEFPGLRAANIDVLAPNKEIKSMYPVVMGIHNKPLDMGKRERMMHNYVAADTSLTGMSDYIQSRDARIMRTARSIVDAEADTLAMARSINRWVHDGMTPEKGLDIVRSVDILKDMRGDADEYTKLFTALSRSVGIATQINNGICYIDGGFRYHSWPSVFVNGTWYDLDPWFGQDTADAARVALIRGGYDSLVEAIKVLSKLQVIIHAYR